MMVSLIKLVKAMVFTALLNKTIRGTLMYALLKPFSSVLRLSTVSMIATIIAALLSQKKDADKDQLRRSKTLIDSIIESMLLKPEKGNSATYAEQETSSAIGAMLAALLRSIEGMPKEEGQSDKNRVIEINDYKVVYDK